MSIRLSIQICSSPQRNIHWNIQLFFRAFFLRGRRHQRNPLQQFNNDSAAGGNLAPLRCGWPPPAWPAHRLRTSTAVPARSGRPLRRLRRAHDARLGGRAGRRRHEAIGRRPLPSALVSGRLLREAGLRQAALGRARVQLRAWVGVAAEALVVIREPDFSPVSRGDALPLEEGRTALAARQPQPRAHAKRDGPVRTALLLQRRRRRARARRLEREQQRERWFGVGVTRVSVAPRCPLAASFSLPPEYSV